MSRLLVVGYAEVPAGLAGFDVLHVKPNHLSLVTADVSGFDALVLLLDEIVDVDVVHMARALADAELAPLLFACGELRPEQAKFLEDYSFNALIDARWPAHLQSLAIAAAIRTFREGTNVVEIQKQVLESAESEVGNLRQLVLRDDLTELYNLRYFREVLKNEHARCEHHERSYSLLFIDLNGLKQVNTNHGHAAGAAVLTQMGHLIARETRTSDYSFRVGGDEFVCICIESDKNAALHVAHRLLKAVRQNVFKFGEIELQVTISVGVAHFPTDGEEADDILAAADAALFEAKNRGKNCAVVAERAGPGQKTQQRAHLKSV